MTVAGMSNADYIRKLRAEAVLRGDCYMCRCRPARHGRRNCEACSAAQYERKRAQEADRRKHRLCPKCGANPVRGRVLCAGCAWLSRQKFARDVSAGLCCHCRRDRGADGTATYCRPCADKMCARNKDKRQENIAAGLCGTLGCGAKLESKYYCLGCLLLLRRARRARVAARAA